MIFASFSFFLISFVAIGLFSATKSKRTSADYLLASGSQKPWLVALSAVATNNSGYMFIGLVGYAFSNGVSAFWIMICALLGDFCASLFVHKNLRIISQKTHSLSFSEALSKWTGKSYPALRIVSALIIVIFLSIYAAAQLRAGGKALHVLFGIDYAIGSTIGGIIVLIYCLAGGIRASIWTNAAQSVVMIGSMAVLFFVSLHEIGGVANFVAGLKNVSPQYFSIFPQDLLFNKWLGLAMFLVGWFFGGFGVIGQIHVMTSFMTLDKPENIKKLRFYYYSWYVMFFALTIATGLAAKLLLPVGAGFDAELAMPSLSHKILPEIFVGFVLAGVFAATMSTADSQILSCSAAITNDLLTKKHASYLAAKLATILVASSAILVAFFDNKSVFSLVMIAWLALACSFAPVLTIYALGQKMSQKMTLICMLCGFTTMMIWRHFDLGKSVYEAAPGIIAGILPFLLLKLFEKIRKKHANNRN